MSLTKSDLQAIRLLISEKLGQLYRKKRTIDSYRHDFYSVADRTRPEETRDAYNLAKRASNRSDTLNRQIRDLEQRLQQVKQDIQNNDGIVKRRRSVVLKSDYFRNQDNG